MLLPFLSLFLAPSLAYNNGAPGSKLPPLGWASWVSLGPKDEHPIFDYCDEFSVKAAADAFVAVGLKDAGYTSFHLDDCWANVQRNDSGFLVGELDHFPKGMKDVADYVHGKGLNFGLYTCAGKYTCVGKRPGSKDHWDQDAAVFAEWGVDWVKMDNCNTKGMGEPKDYYPFMSRALNKTGRPIHFNMCEWGKQNPWEWGAEISQSWRMHGDHIGIWSSTKHCINASAAIPAEYTGVPWGWNDMDMLETGNYDQAAHANGKESNMTDVEYRTEFSMWAISASPLVVTTPIMNCSSGRTSRSPPLGSVKTSTCGALLKARSSHEQCVLGQSFGCHDGKQTMWVDKGCRGKFIVDGAPVICEPEGEGKHYCGAVNCRPTITDLQKEILLNTEIIAINQDVTPQGRPVVEGDLRIWARKLTGGDVAVALYNENDDSINVGLDFSLLGWPSTKHAKVRDLWAHKDLGQFQGHYPEKGKTVEVEPHGTVMLRVSPTKGE